MENLTLDEGAWRFTRNTSLNSEKKYDLESFYFHHSLHSFCSLVLNELSRPIIYSLSPGTNANPTMAKDVSGLVNMYRVTGDDWDNWKDIAAHFNVAS
ncbi:hypothetical protein RND71_003237 [Anisodus tanguticus]|uniref:Uncharacterized protein n=1 Tax=Anisodus tanguticus TaxID=243964 RepID=A0AAE1SYB0_9SOLA|nr:hypothetical protein RND71_003237 [Anisodus tanguticus]